MSGFMTTLFMFGNWLVTNYIKGEKMKSKAEEIKQFKLFLGRIEKGGYLDNMFGNMMHYVERQILDDLGPDIRQIIYGHEESRGKIRSLESRLEDETRIKKDLQKAVDDISKKLEATTVGLERLNLVEKDVERLQLEKTELREELHNCQEEYNEKNAKLNITSKRVAKLTSRIQELKVLLFDKMEVIEKLEKQGS